MKKDWLLGLCLFFSVFLNGQQKYLNLDFETSIYDTSFPKIWDINGVSNNLALDSIEFFSGKKSLSIDRTDSNIKGVNILLSKLPKHRFSSDTLTFNGHIKTINVSNGFAGLILRMDGRDGMLAFDNMVDKGISGTVDWTEASVKMAIPDNTTDIYIGLIFVGTGKAYFDSFEVTYDNMVYEDVPPVLKTPNLDDIKWLSKQVCHLSGTNPDIENDNDLRAFRKIFKDAEIVALGESTHGSHEIFQMKHRLLKFFRDNMDFDYFAMEANMVEAKKINNYVLTGEGNPKTLLRNLGFWTWNTTEILDIIYWMYGHNMGYNLKEKMKFGGFDIQNPSAPILELKQTYGQNINIFSSLESNLDSLKKDAKNIELRNLINGQLNTLHMILSDKMITTKSKTWLNQNINLIKQSIDFNLKESRDRYMADNISWIRENNGNPKMILWAHNGHVKNSGNSMGSKLKNKYGDKYLSVGFAFHSGFYNAKGPEGLKAYRAQSSHPGTYEFFFQAIEKPIFFLDLRKLGKKTKIFNWITKEMDFRVVGANRLRNEFYPTKLIDDFDVLVFIKNTSPTQLITD